MLARFLFFSFTFLLRTSYLGTLVIWPIMGTTRIRFYLLRLSDSIPMAHSSPKFIITVFIISNPSMIVISLAHAYGKQRSHTLPFLGLLALCFSC